MTGGPSVVAAVPLHTEVSVTGGDGGPVLLRSPDAAPTSRAVLVPDLGVDAGDGVDYMQATANVITGAWPLLMGGATIEARSTVPVGAGLSSNAALTATTAPALMRFAVGVIPAAVSVAWAAYDAETGQLGTGAGWMDFLACTHGGVCRIDAGYPPRVTRLSGGLGAPLRCRSCAGRRSIRGGASGSSLHRTWRQTLPGRSRVQSGSGSKPPSAPMLFQSAATTVACPGSSSIAATMRASPSRFSGSQGDRWVTATQGRCGPWAVVTLPKPSRRTPSRSTPLGRWR